MNNPVSVYVMREDAV